jgi:hypothetical protein
MSDNPFRKDDPFLKVLAVTFVAGLGVAGVLCALWRYHAGEISATARVAAIAVCPPFLLAGILEATSDSALALVMTIGCIVFGNGFLYAGLASFVYFLTTVFFGRKV